MALCLLQLDAERAHDSGEYASDDYKVAGVDMEPFHAALMHRNERLCARATQCTYWRGTTADEAPPYWQKVLMTHRALHHGVRGTRCLVVLWLDRDATVSSMDKTAAHGRAITLTEGGLAALRGRDIRMSHDGWRDCHAFPACCGSSRRHHWAHCLRFSSGAFLVRGSSAGRQFVDAWMAHWTREARHFWVRRNASAASTSYRSSHYWQCATTPPHPQQSAQLTRARDGVRTPRHGRQMLQQARASKVAQSAPLEAALVHPSGGARCAWAGREYEQGALVSLVPRYAHHVVAVPDDGWNDPTAACSVEQRASTSPASPINGGDTGASSASDQPSRSVAWAGGQSAANRTLARRAREHPQAGVLSSGEIEIKHFNNIKRKRMLRDYVRACIAPADGAARALPLEPLISPLAARGFVDAFVASFGASLALLAAMLCAMRCEALLFLYRRSVPRRTARGCWGGTVLGASVGREA